MTHTDIYQDIATRTGGDIYIGVVGPVRTGKSTFIKRFMDTLVIPNIENVYARERAKDELPQSGSGRTIMTAEPKFVPEEAAQITMDGGAELSVRLIDCVGYMVDGAVGQTENGEERMVTTPWFDHEVSMTQAAEAGTRKVIAEHSTIGIVVTTDGTITEIPADSYIEAEERVINELTEIGKPFVVLVNSADPTGEAALRARDRVMGKYNAACVIANCMTLTEDDITGIIKSVLYEFPVTETGIFLPTWVDALPTDHPIKTMLFQAVRESAKSLVRIRDAKGCIEAIGSCEAISRAEILSMDLAEGRVTASAELPRSLFYTTLSDQSGLTIRDDGDLMGLLTDLAVMKNDYEKIQSALHDVREKGYGIVYPTAEEMKLQEPEIVRQGGRYGVKLKASAPSIHMIMANIETEVNPAVGGEKSSEDIISFLLQEFEGDTSRIWESNIFGKSLYDIAGEGLNAKIKHMPEEAQGKLQQTLQRIINEGSNGLICIIL